MQVQSASWSHSAALHSPSMSELLGFVPTPKTGNPQSAPEQAAPRPSVTLSYSFGMRKRPGGLPLDKMLTVCKPKHPSNHHILKSPTSTEVQTTAYYGSFYEAKSVDTLAMRCVLNR